MNTQLAETTGEKPCIVIAGAGSIGCFVGGYLRFYGHNVSFYGRPNVVEILRKNGLGATDLEERTVFIQPQDLNVTASPEILNDADIILVCVKSSATEDIGDLIKEHTHSRPIVVSLQNGVTNADRLRNRLPDLDVRAGIVEFNVVQTSDGVFHRGTSGKIILQSGEPLIGEMLCIPAVEFADTHEITDFMWGKLLLNLNNSLNALSDLPLKTQLEDRDWRRILANMMEEALSVMKAAGITPKSQAPLPLRFIPKVLRLPTPLFRIVAARMLRIDPEARSSMWEDFERGRRTEVNELQGAILELAQKLGREAPWNKCVLEHVQQVEKTGSGSPGLSASNIYVD